MENIKIATAQFENKSGDKEYNLSVIDRLSEKAASEGAQAIAFHECSVTGYTFARTLSRDQMFDLCEFIPEGESIRQLQSIAKKIKFCAGRAV
jgi:predicted amidohydrolase